MKSNGQTIWDTRIQGATGVVSAQAEHGVELFATGTFGQLSLDPPRVVVNCNYKYPIDRAIFEQRRFAINILRPEQDRLVAALMNLRRREPEKARVLGLNVAKGSHEIPYLEGAHTVLFCELEQDIDQGDRRLCVGRVIHRQTDDSGGRPLLFGDVLDAHKAFPKLQRTVRSFANRTGTRDLAKRLLRRGSRQPQRSIAETTYEVGGATRSEIDLVLEQETVDLGRRLRPPVRPSSCDAAVGICVAGTSWGAMHCDWVREVNPRARLFVCGRDNDKTERLANRVGAVDAFIDLETAAKDSRVDCLSLALPHDFHLEALQIAAAAGKHVLVEKPIATNLADARRMMEIADKAGIMLMVAENAHYRPAVHEALRRIEQGDIGEPLYMLVHGGGPMRPAGWKRDKEKMGGGVLMDIGVHYIRALRLLMGEPDCVSASRAMQVNTKMEGDDSVQLVFGSRYGWECHMLLSWATMRGAVPDILIAGDRGTIHLWPGKRYLDYYPIAPTLRSQLLSKVRPYWLQAKFQRAENQRVRVRLSDRDKSGYLGEMRDFLSAVAENRPPQCTAEDACRDLEIVLSSYESLDRHERVNL